MGARRPAKATKVAKATAIRRSKRMMDSPNKIIKATSIMTSVCSSRSSSTSLSPPPPWLDLSDTVAAKPAAPLAAPAATRSLPLKSKAGASSSAVVKGSATRQGRRPPPRPPAQNRNPPASQCHDAARLCHFCEHDPVGRAMHAQRPCDWQDGYYPLECSNCADYRALNPVSAASHVCRVEKKAHVWRKYSLHHPMRYDQAIDPSTGQPSAAGVACVKCIADNRRNACDVDPILGYGCSRCKVSDNCSLPNGRAMEHKPNLRQGVVKWFRHACDSCAVLGSTRRVQMQQCSWLVDRSTWLEPCNRCRTRNLACLGSAMVVALPNAVTIPESWIPRSYIAMGWVELRRNTAWRSACTNCLRDNNHCRASIAYPLSACGRCTVMGLDCIDCQGTAYPIFDLSQVGFGFFMPFTACRRCVERGRNCDRQRPCDSCTDAGEADQCDNVFLKTTASKKRLSNCIHGRLDPPPGPLYYLAHGYGANGVNDVKDGSRLEHWIGPFVESYAMSSPFFRERLHGTAVSRQRLARMPRSVPPHAAPGTPLATLSTSQLTVDHIVGMINQSWPGAYLMNTTPNFATDQQRAIMIKATQVFLGPAGGDAPPTAAELALAINPNPNPGPVRINSVVPALQVVLSPQVAAEAAAEADDEEGTGEDDNGDNDGGNNAAGPSTQVPQQTTQPAAAGQQFGQFIFPQVAPQLPAPQQPAPMPQTAPMPQPPIQQGLIFPQPAMLQPPPMNRPASQFPRAEAVLSMFGHLFQQPNQGAAAPPPPHASSGSASAFMAPDGAMEDIPIDPALQVWDPPTPEPVLPYNPLGAPPPPISLDTTTMPGHAMMLPPLPPEIGLNIPNLYNTDLLDPNLTAFLNDAQNLAASDAAMSWLHPQNAVNANHHHHHQQMFGVNPFAALPLAVEQEQQQSPSAVFAQADKNKAPVRWRHLNPIHEFTRELLVNRDNYGEVLLRKPFTLGISYLKESCAVKDKLHDIPEPVADDPNKAADMQQQMGIDPEGGPRCGESGFDENGDGTGTYLACGKAAHGSDKCASNQHHDGIPIIVCDGCAQYSSQILVDPRYQPLTAAEVLNMRSYLCRGCSAKAGASVEAMLIMCEAGINKVYGMSPNGSGFGDADGDAEMTDVTAPDGGSMKFFKHARPMTGCSCGVKMFRTRQCNFHRVDHAEQVLHQVAAVQEWRIQTEQQGKCAGCFEDRCAADLAMQRQQPPQTQMPTGELGSWVCLACGGWVMNQTGSASKPGLVAGWQSWFNPPPTSLTVIPEEPGDLDVEMTDA